MPIFNEKGMNRSVETTLQRDSIRLIEAQSSHRSSSLNKTSYKGLDSMTQQKFQVGKPNKYGTGSITSQSNQIPEVFLKTRYGGAQYSYQIKENLSEGIEKHSKNNR